jgi:alpha,alpha-trehalose-phosphate synthase [UDP-forming]
MNQGNKLIVVSNRLPISIERTSGEQYQVAASSGGLVTALDSVLRKYSGVWIGYAGEETDEEVLRLIELASLDHPYRMEAVPLAAEEISKFYFGFCNEIIWPLFHDLQSRCNFDPEYWQAYQDVNRRFADAAAAFVSNDSFVWVHDYHFVLAGSYLREHNDAVGIGFFQHIPFPPPDIFEKLPWRTALLQGLLDYDVVGFQTERDQRNFLACVEALLTGTRIVRRTDGYHVHYKGRCARVAAFPISIDFHEFADVAARDDVAAQVRQFKLDHQGRKIILGIDRLDYTKGIVERLRAYRHMLRKYPEMRRAVTFLQLVVPSRADIPKYRELKEEIERLVSEINGEFSDASWVPVHYLYRRFAREQLIVYYRAVDVALVTPLKDGMNLVSKEYCASQVGETGVLILSEFAGSAAQLRHGAMLVNPNDQEAVADAIVAACEMPVTQRVWRMSQLRLHLRENDVYDWAESFLDAGRKLSVATCVPMSGMEVRAAAGQD